MNNTAHKVTLLGKSYPVRFGFKFQRIYMDHIGTNKIAEYQRSLNSMVKMETNEAWEAIGFFVLSAIQAASKKPINIDPDDIIDDLNFNGEGVLADLMVAFTASQPVQDTQSAVGKSKVTQ